MQPSIGATQRQPELVRAQYSDPVAIKAMQAQAEAMRKAIQQQQAGAKSAAELEREWGL
jgi:hypothetical protein